MRRGRGVEAALAFLLLAFLPGCETIGTIFEAGIWFGIVLVIAVIAAIIFIAVRFGPHD